MSIVIAGFSGIGKTTLSGKYKNVIDLDASEFVYDDSDISDIPFEQRKGEIRKLNNAWPKNYIDAINLATKQYDIVLVWDREDIIEQYIKNKIDFILCYPDFKDLDNYVERFKQRGNTDKYINWKLEQYREKMKVFDNLDVKKIVLENNEMLEDYLIKNNFKLKQS